MQRLFNIICFAVLLSLLSWISGFANTHSIFRPIVCMKLIATHNQYTQSISFINNCSKAIDMKDKTLQFHMSRPPDDGRDFWGDFGSLCYPTQPYIRTQKDSFSDDYIVEIKFIYPDTDCVNYKLEVNKKIRITFLFSESTPNNLIFF